MKRASPLPPRPTVLAGLVLLAPLLLLCTSCITGSWQREHRYMRPPRGSISSLEPGVHDLAHCLDQLGAPLFVYETPGGFAVAYGWYKSRDLGGSVSVPLSEAANASFSMRGLDGRMQGLVLFFGPEAELLLLQRGPLRDLAVGAERVRPTFVDDGD